MTLDEGLVEEINELWEPVYPHMAAHLLELSGARGGLLLDIGPFGGDLALAVLEAGRGFRAVVGGSSERLLDRVGRLAARRGRTGRVGLVRTAEDSLPVRDRSCDLVVVRGAYFFLTPALLRDAVRVLRPGGFAWIGGGYGARTPRAVIGPIADRSRWLNEKAGKQWVSAAQVAGLVGEAGLSGRARVSAEGGLWVEVRG